MARCPVTVACAAVTHEKNMSERPSHTERYNHERGTASRGPLTPEEIDILGAEERALLEFFLAESLLDPSHAELLNEGNNGIIVKLTIDEALLRTADPTATLRPLIGDGSQVAAKILKLYKSPLVGRQEYESQLAAWQVVENARMNDAQETHPSQQIARRSAFASIPQPRIFADLPVHEHLAQTLRDKGVHADERVSILLMDLVDGDDIATTLYRSVLAGHPDAKHLAHEDLSCWPFHELSQEVARLFYARPRHTDTTHDAEYRMMLQNAERLMHECGRVGIRIDEWIIAQISNSLRALKYQGVLLRDAHPRNFMVTGSLTQGGCASIVDFGEAVLLGRPVTEDDYVSADGTERYGSMDNIVALLKGINAQTERRTKHARNETRAEARIAAIVRAPALVRGDNETLLGFARSRSAAKNKMPIVRHALNHALDVFTESGSWDGSVFRAALKDAQGKPVRQTNADKSERTKLWNAQVLLNALLGCAFERAVRDEFTKEDIERLVAGLAEDPVFSEVVHDTEHWKYWGDVDFVKIVPSLLWQSVEKKRVQPHT